jgi:nucleoside-diphosphate-sugar epimerase
MRRVLIAGCGDVGTALGLLLAADGDEVRGLRRRPEGLPAPLVALRGDLRTGDGLARAAAGVTHLVYAAAADGFSDDAYRQAYVEGLQRMLDALQAARAPLERVLFTSSTAVYGQDDGGWVDESSPTEPAGFSGRRMLEAESLLLGCVVPATVLRLAGIYGPGRTRLIDEVRDGASTVPDGVPAYTNRIHVADCAGAIRHLLRLPGRRANGVWLGVDDEPCERALVLDWLADRMGVARPRRVAASAAARGRGGNKRCRNAKLVGSGYVLRFPTFRDGYADVLAAPPSDAAR